jgi:hypothetical protein
LEAVWFILRCLTVKNSAVMASRMSEREQREMKDWAESMAEGESVVVVELLTFV